MLSLSIVLLVIGFIIVIMYRNFPSDNKVEGILMTNKQKKNRAYIGGFGFILLGLFLLIKYIFT